MDLILECVMAKELDSNSIESIKIPEDSFAIGVLLSYPINNIKPEASKTLLEQFLRISSCESLPLSIRTASLIKLYKYIIESPDISNLNISTILQLLTSATDLVIQIPSDSNNYYDYLIKCINKTISRICFDLRTKKEVINIVIAFYPLIDKINKPCDVFELPLELLYEIHNLSYENIRNLLDIIERVYREILRLNSKDFDPIKNIGYMMIMKLFDNIENDKENIKKIEEILIKYFEIFNKTQKNKIIGFYENMCKRFSMVGSKLIIGQSHQKQDFKEDIKSAWDFIEDDAYEPYSNPMPSESLSLSSVIKNYIDDTKKKFNIEYLRNDSIRDDFNKIYSNNSQNPNQIFDEIYKILEKEDKKSTKFWIFIGSAMRKTKFYDKQQVDKIFYYIDVLNGKYQKKYEDPETFKTENSGISSSQDSRFNRNTVAIEDKWRKIDTIIEPSSIKNNLNSDPLVIQDKKEDSTPFIEPTPIKSGTNKNFVGTEEKKEPLDSFVVSTPIENDSSKDLGTIKEKKENLDLTNIKEQKEEMNSFIELNPIKDNIPEPSVLTLSQLNENIQKHVDLSIPSSSYFENMQSYLSIFEDTLRKKFPNSSVAVKGSLFYKLFLLSGSIDIYIKDPSYKERSQLQSDIVEHFSQSPYEIFPDYIELKLEYKIHLYYNRDIVSYTGDLIARYNNSMSVNTFLYYIKIWGKALGIEYNGYMWTLVGIFYLCNSSPPVLKNLQLPELHPLVSVEYCDVWTDPENYDSLDISPGEIFIGFIKFLSENIGSTLCTKTGEITKSNEYALAVTDFFTEKILGLSISSTHQLSQKIHESLEGVHGVIIKKSD